MWLFTPEGLYGEDESEVTKVTTGNQNVVTPNRALQSSIPEEVTKVTKNNEDTYRDDTRAHDPVNTSYPPQVGYPVTSSGLAHQMG